VTYVVLLLGAIGHLILWVALVNRAHALGIRRRWVSLMTLACIILCVMMPIAILVALVSINAPEPTLLTTMLYAAARTYIVACAAVCVVATIQRLSWRIHAERQGVLASNHTSRVKLSEHISEPLTAPGVASWLRRLPGNEILDVCVHDKKVLVPRLSPDREGLRIAHLSDLHMSGRMARAFYEFVVEETNRCEPDIIAITGDIVDSDDCLPWIPEVLGRLSSAGGVYYVLGNHDRRVNQEGLKEALAKTGWTHLAGPPVRRSVRNLDLLLGGNECPWFGTPTDFSADPPRGADDPPRRADDPPRRADGQPLRIALSHSPDQIGWARANDVDLMLAGHVHGGQICLPILGAFTAPSMHGVRYAAGTFRVQDTVMHVSRGTASLTPLRWNCPPEIAVLNLLAPTEL
jgi:predicted MPP superfamily phosphohydrolase